MSLPAELRYSESHEWYRVDSDVVTVGITQHAADELTDITYVELPQVGKELTAGEAFGEIESVKATSELLCQLGGVVTAINEQLADDPALVNNDPFGEGWMIKIKCKDLSPLEKLMTAEQYAAHIGK
jgi:glycine cleavage system H protein